MPWIFRSLLGISIALLPLFCYVGLRLVSSIGKVRAAYKRRAYLCFLIIVAWLILLPLAFFLLPRLGLGGTVDLRETLGWDDYLFRYPLWVGMIIVLELASPFILVRSGGDGNPVDSGAPAEVGNLPSLPPACPRASCCHVCGCQSGS